MRSLRTRALPSIRLALRPEQGSAMASRSSRYLTVETALFGVLLLLAFLIRFVRLDLPLLSPAESVRALGAWQLTQGQLPGWWDAPALVLATASGFVLFGASDATASAPRGGARASGSSLAPPPLAGPVALPGEPRLAGPLSHRNRHLPHRL